MWAEARMPQTAILAKLEPTTSPNVNTFFSYYCASKMPLVTSIVIEIH
jgi:hypothetical protein